MTKIIITILVTMFSNIIQYAQDLELHLKLDKTEYLICEPIICEVTIINKSSQDIKITNFEENQNHESLGFHPIASANKSKGIFNTLSSSHFSYSEYNLLPGDTAYYMIDLVEQYGNGAKHFAGGGRRIAIISDNYKLQYELLTMLNNKKYQYLSNIVEFSVVEPNEEEDAVLTKYFFDNHEPEKLLELIEDNKNSSYLLLMEKKLMASYIFKGGYQNPNLVKEYLISNPSTALLKYFHTSYRLEYLTKFLSDDNFKKTLKNSKLSNYTHERVNFDRKRRQYIIEKSNKIRKQNKIKHKEEKRQQNEK